MTNIVTVLVSGINWLLKKVNISLIKDIGIEREDK